MFSTCAFVQSNSQVFWMMQLLTSLSSSKSIKDFPVGPMVKNLPANAGDLGSIPGSGRSPGEGNDNPLQYSCLENPMDRGAWGATVHRVAKSQTRLSTAQHSTFYNWCFESVQNSINKLPVTIILKKAAYFWIVTCLSHVPSIWKTYLIINRGLGVSAGTSISSCSYLG